MATTPDKIGKYQIDSLLGRGGMGEVYKAYDGTLGRFVALKIMRGLFLDDTNARERFIREAQAAGGLRHPNIVTVYDLGEVESQLFIAMEFIHGDDLEKVIRNRTPWLIEDKLNIMIQVCEGMSYAHKHQIVHRDLKPSNIRIDDEGIAKIMDFGVAKLGTSTMTASGTVMGTAYYMSPEQVRGMRVDSRSDLFSLGTILYELFAYQKAFSGEMTAVFYKIAHEQPALLSEFMDVPTEPLQKIVDICLEKDKAKRIQTSGELADLLRQAQNIYRESKVATVCGIKTVDVPEGTPEARVATAPAAITTKKRIQAGASPASPDAGSIPTELMSGPPPGAAASTKLEARKLLGDVPVAEAPAAGSITGKTSVNATTSRRPVALIAALAAIVALFGGGYYFLSRNHSGERTQSSVAHQDIKPQPPSRTETPENVHPAVDYATQLANAKNLHQQGKYEEAAGVYARLLDQHSSDANLHFLMGAVKQKMRKNQEALLEFQKAVELDEKMNRAWEQIGFLLMNRMDYGGAEDAFQRSLALNPRSAPSWEGLAQTHLVSQQPQKAEDDYKKLLEIEPNNISAIYNLGQLQWNRKDAGAAKGSFKRVIELNPNYAEAHNNLGAIYLSEGQVASSITQNEKAVELKPALASAHYSLYLAYEQQKSFRLAGEHLKKYLEITEDDDPELKKKLKQYLQ